MNIIKLIIYLLLALLPVAILIRDWKFSDRRTKKHLNITRIIIIFWCIGSLVGTYFVWTNSSQMDELIDGKDQLLAKIESYQNELEKKTGYN